MPINRRGPCLVYCHDWMAIGSVDFFLINKVKTKIRGEEKKPWSLMQIPTSLTPMATTARSPPMMISPPPTLMMMEVSEPLPHPFQWWQRFDPWLEL